MGTASCRCRLATHRMATTPRDPGRRRSVAVPGDGGSRTWSATRRTRSCTSSRHDSAYRSAPSTATTTTSLQSFAKRRSCSARIRSRLGSSYGVCWRPGYDAVRVTSSARRFSRALLLSRVAQLPRVVQHRTVEEAPHDSRPPAAPVVVADVRVLGAHVTHVALVPIGGCTEDRQVGVGENLTVVIAVVGIVLRGRLDETRDFLDERRGRVESLEQPSCEGGAARLVVGLRRVVDHIVQPHRARSPRRSQRADRPLQACRRCVRACDSAGAVPRIERQVDCSAGDRVLGSAPRRQQRDQAGREDSLRHSARYVGYSRLGVIQPDSTSSACIRGRLRHGTPMST